MIVDCGGGTVDIIAHSTRFDDQNRFCVRELVAGDGALCGGIFIDKEFLEYLVDFVGVEALDELKKSGTPEEYLALMNSWETIKRSFTGFEESSIALNLPRGLLIY